MTIDLMNLAFLEDTPIGNCTSSYIYTTPGSSINSIGISHDRLWSIQMQHHFSATRSVQSKRGKNGAFNSSLRQDISHFLTSLIFCRRSTSEVCPDTAAPLVLLALNRLFSSTHVSANCSTGRIKSSSGSNCPNPQSSSGF